MENLNALICHSHRLSSICMTTLRGTIYRSSCTGQGQSVNVPLVRPSCKCHVDDKGRETRPGISTKADSKDTKELTASRLVCLQGKEKVKPRGRRAPFIPI